MTTTVQRLGQLTNTIHGFIYFAPEAAEEYSAIGLAGRQQYFASRAAPMGAVGPEMIIATFFNFWPGAIESAIPAAWAVAAPDDVQQARFRGAARVLNGALDDAFDPTEATAILRRIAEGVGYEGKPLAAANRSVAMPDDPVLEFWQWLTVVREWRGDAHVAALGAAPVTAVEALVLHAATGKVPKAGLQRTRAWPEADWQAGVDSLVARGLVTADEAFTDAGREFRDGIEDQTNRAAQALVDTVGDTDAERLCDLLKPVNDAVIASGVFANMLKTE